jgi:phosphodiesterase/alkaline phosphatase D-like protein
MSIRKLTLVGATALGLLLVAFALASAGALAAAPPEVSTGGASAITRSEASLTGTVNPQGLETTYAYQFGLSTEYGQSQPAYPGGIGVGSEATAVAAPLRLAPLTPGTTYHYRLTATNEEGTSYGQDESFTTVANRPPIVGTGGASGISANGATISGTVDPLEVEAKYAFEYGADTGYGSQAFGTVDPEQGEQVVTLSLQGLEPGTTYHYRLVAGNPGGTATGSDGTFTTATVASPIGAPAVAPLLATPSIAFPVAARVVPGKVVPRKLTRAQKLTAALRACAKKLKSNRSACRRRARKKYAGAK